jgi:endonuclease/exonuclease/phosphatase family metal-dependent hydrolase
MEFCIENNIFIANTNFQHHKCCLYMWRSPDGKTLNQIDFMVVKPRWRTSVQDIKTYPGMDCNSDHNALVVEVSLKMRIEGMQHHVNA